MSVCERERERQEFGCNLIRQNVLYLQDMNIQKLSTHIIIDQSILRLIDPTPKQQRHG